MAEGLSELLKALTDAHGVPGQESGVASVMQTELSEYAELDRDRLGSVIARRGGASDTPRVMVAGHMDEVGFMVTMITDEGFLKFQTLGGWWEQVMLAQRVRVITRSGEITGVIGSKPPHVLPADERKKPVEKRDMFIDIGVGSKEEAMEVGVQPGDPVVPVCTFERLANPKYIMAKALDNRVGCALVIELLRRLHGTQHPNTVFGVATVQEEVGLRGAATSTHQIEPDIGFSIDTGIAGDTPGMKPDEAQAKLGKGPTILLYDASMVGHLRLRDFVVETAEEASIPIQFDAMSGGGTDAGRMHLYGRGVPSLALTVPVRYIHSHAGILHLDDVENAARLLVEVCNRLDGARLAEIVG